MRERQDLRYLTLCVGCFLAFSSCSAERLLKRGGGANGSDADERSLRLGSGAVSVEAHNVADLLGRGCNIVKNAADAVCLNAATQLCRDLGYANGGLISSSGTVFSTVNCSLPRSTDVEFPTPANGPNGKERPFKIGKNILGSYVTGPAETNTPDTLVNTSGRSLLVRSVNYGTTYAGAHGYSRDTCLYLNRAMIWQADDNDDGELVCTYSDASKDPSQNFRDTGLLLRPGERIVFHATPRWGKDASGQPFGLNEFVWAELEVSDVGGAIPVRRVRFPKWDSAYSVNGSSFLEAGNQSAIPLPAAVPPDKPKQNSNWWYVPPGATTIRGLSIFMSNGLPGGVQGGKACVRVVAQGGAPLAAPRCFQLQDDKFAPESFNRAFGAAQGGSALVRFDQAVPAGALVGVDFTLSSETYSGGMDMAAYVWFEAASAVGNPAPAPAVVPVVAPSVIPAVGPVAPNASPPTGCKNELLPHESLGANQQICSTDGRFVVTLQGDGNLVLTRVADGKVLWHANKQGSSPRAVVQPDGNFVLYHGTAAVWYTSTVGIAVKHLVIQDDGNLVLYASDGRAPWHTGTQQ